MAMKYHPIFNTKKPVHFQYLDLPVWMPNGSVTGCQFTLPLGSTWHPNWKVLVGTPGCTSSIGMIWVWPLGLGWDSRTCKSSSWWCYWGMIRKPFWDEGTSMIRKPTWENPYDNSDQIGISWLHPWKIDKFEPQKMEVWFRWFSFSTGWFLGSKIFRGVCLGRVFLCLMNHHQFWNDA